MRREEDGPAAIAAMVRDFCRDQLRGAGILNDQNLRVVVAYTAGWLMAKGTEPFEVVLWRTAVSEAVLRMKENRL